MNALLIILLWFVGAVISVYLLTLLDDESLDDETICLMLVLWPLVLPFVIFRLLICKVKELTQQKKPNICDGCIHDKVCERDKKTMAIMSGTNSQEIEWKCLSYKKSYTEEEEEENGRKY